MNQSGEQFIDESEALKRLGGNKKLYAKLLKTFLADKTGENLRKSMEEGNPKDAQLAAHSIKGMTANLSLKALYEDASTLDAMLKHEEIDFGVLEAFEVTWGGTLRAIEAFLESVGV